MSFGTDPDLFTLTGELNYEPDHDLLELDILDGEMPEQLSTCRLACGLVAPDGHVWSKDWSEHTGVATSLGVSGVAEIVRTERVGPFVSAAHLVRLTFVDDSQEEPGRDA